MTDRGSRILTLHSREERKQGKGSCLPLSPIRERMGLVKTTMVLSAEGPMSPRSAPPSVRLQTY